MNTIKNIFLKSKIMIKKSAHFFIVFTFSAISMPTFADLPTMEAPSRGEGGGIVETIQNYFFDAVTLAGLVICAIGFLVVAVSAVSTFSEVREGKKKWGDFGMLVLVGVILIVLIIWLVNKASNIL